MQEIEGVLEANLAILANTDQNSPSPQPSPPRGGEGEVIIAANPVPEKVRDRQSTDDQGLAVNPGIATGHYLLNPPFSKGGLNHAKSSVPDRATRANMRSILFFILNINYSDICKINY